MMDDALADGEAALWAIGAREAAPRPMSPAFVAEVASLREVVALLAMGLDAVAPDARVWPALQRELPGGDANRVAPPPVDDIARRRARLAYAVAGVSAAAAAAAALLWLDARAARDHASEDRAALRERLDPLTSPDLTLTTFHGQDAGVARVLAGAGGRRWLVIALDLPSVAGHDYQLWFVPEAGAPVSAGLLRPDLLGVHDALTTVPSELGRVRPAISLEPSGGSPSPTVVKLVGDMI
jgi:anti-sigma-K factor RskA